MANILAHEATARQLAEISGLKKQLELENAYLTEEISTYHQHGEVVGNSPALRAVFEGLTLVAPTEATVLIEGETGTGKELLARALHRASRRAGKPLIKLNCAALPAALIESELFGHERGAFTGATERRIGKFELAHGGTLFLDEIGELPLDLQAKLLRAIQEKEVERLGSNKVVAADARLVAATHRDLLREVREGRFRQDLYYRLNVFPLRLPPLRERPNDIPPLVAHFVGRNARKLGKPLRGVTQAVMEQLQAYLWPGNVRELEHVIERSAILCRGPLVREVYLPAFPPPHSPNPAAPEQPLLPLAEHERDHILRALRQSKGKVSGPGGAAELLRIKSTTLDARMKKLNIGLKRVPRSQGTSPAASDT